MKCFASMDSAEEPPDSRTFIVHDRRAGHEGDSRIEFSGSSCSDLKQCIREKFQISTEEEFVVADTSEKPLGFQTDLATLQKNATLIIQNEAGKAFQTPVKRKINVQPHYNTIVKSGQYDYYASEGHDPLPYAIAELIDNSLSATMNNTDTRKIEIRLYLDGASSKNWMICVLDNGKGMTAKELEDWAVLRRSKFDANREYNRAPMDSPDKPRFLNSDISFFGVGGKQACFYMGESVTVFTKAAGSANVCEVTMAKERFQEREKSGRQVYNEELIHRQPGDDSYMPSTANPLMRKLLNEEPGKESFTHVVITETRKGNFKIVKKDMEQLCLELANTYHYYIHGETGISPGSKESMSDEKAGPSSKHATGQSRVDISITRYNKDGFEINRTKLRDIVQNSQSQFIKTSADTFEFQIEVPINLEGEADQPFGKEMGKVEGILRYHPFLYTKETFPGAVETDPLDEDDIQVGDLHARGTNAIFDCYWNGRLIPYTTIKDFDWCSRKKTERTIPEECFNRVSGVLFTNDVFRISTNKLTFLDLAEKLKAQDVIFDPKIGGQYKRSANIGSKFREWLQKCHNEHDKQILFKEPDGHISRNRKIWTRFRSIVWCGQTFKQGKLVRTQDKANPVHGRIKCFLLEGEHNIDELYSAGGIFELKLEPEMVFQGESAEYPLRFLDRTATDEDIERSLDIEKIKLPTILLYEWIGSHDMKIEDGNQTLVSGKKMGGIRAVIRSTDGRDISKMPSHSKGKGPGKWLGVRVRLCRIVQTPDPANTPDGATFTEECLLELENMTKSTDKLEQPGYYFKPFRITDPTLGKYVIRLEVIMKDPKLSDASPELPKVEIPFTIVAGPASCFCIQDIPPSIRMGQSFSIKLGLLDENGKPGLPTENITPSIAAFDGQNRHLEVGYDEGICEDNSLIIHGVRVCGNLGTSKYASSIRGKVTISLPQLLNQVPEMKDIILRPGIPHRIHVPQFQTAFTHKNGGPMKIEVEIKDAYNNLTHGAKDLRILCKLCGDADLPSYYATLNSDGKAILTGERILIKNLRGSKDIRALVYCLDCEYNMEVVKADIKIEPREGPCVIQVLNGQGVEIQHGEEINCVAGEVIDGLAFKLFDEAGNEIPVSDELASDINYFGATPNDPAIFKTGKLPPIRTDHTVEANPIKRYQIRLRNTEVEFEFIVRSIPGKPAHMRCSPVGSGQLHCGDILDVLVQITDENGNIVEGLRKREDISLQTLEGKAMPFEQLEQDSRQFIIRNIQYPKVVSFTTGNFQGMVHYLAFSAEFTVKLLPGPPRQLVCISHDSDPKLNIHNGIAIEDSLIFRLLDEFNNCIFDPENEIEIQCSPNLTVISDKASTRPNESSGEIAFSGLTLQGANDEPHPVNSLPSDKHFIWAKLKRTQIKSTLIDIEILPNPNQPHSIDVEFDRQIGGLYEAGTIMPCVNVVVKAEDGTVMTGLPSDSLKAEITNDSTDLAPSEIMQQEEEDNEMELTSGSEMQATDVENGYFFFMLIPVPKHVGQYKLTFHLQVGGDEFRSNEEIITVYSGKPIKLMPKSDIAESHVSNKDQPEDRLVMKAASLYLMDTHGNEAGTDVSGTVEIGIAGSSDEVPLIEGQSTFTLENGHAHIPNIYLQKGCPGIATTYTLLFTPQLPGSENDIDPFELHFKFYNDVKEREKNAKLTQQRSDIQKKITSLGKEQKNRETRRKNLEGKLEKAQNQVGSLLSSAGKELTHLKTVEEVEIEKSRLEQRANEAKKQPRRDCTIPVYATGDADILGKVAHLAEVQEDKDSEVISWHLESYMESVVTRNMHKALQLQDMTNGEQGVLALDANVHIDWEKKLPHEILKRQQGKVPSNITYARRLLKFGDHPDECKQVFTQLLGDTIIVDTLPDAVSYRKMILQRTSCPTLLTRDGHRLMDNGAFSGSKNRCPIDMKGRVFRQPEPSELYDLRKKIEILSHVEEVFQVVKDAEDDLMNHTDLEKSEAVQLEKTELENAEKELQAINEMLLQDTTNRGTRKRQTSNNVQTRTQSKRAKKQAAS